MRQQMQQGGPSSPSCSSTSHCLPLSHLNTAECGSETPAEPEKHEPTGVSSMRSIMIFYICYLLCLALGLACVVCVCVWNTQWRGGFAWDGKARQFNWHPVLMVTGLVVVYGIAAVLYRIPLTWGQNKLPWKLLHAALMLVALVLSIVGLCAVFDFHNVNNIPNLYSLHSWIGIAATALFAMQWVVGVAGFLLPCSPISLRKLLKPIHVWLGGSILSLSIAACISGINEKLFFVLKSTANGSQPYSKLPPEALFGNSLGVLIVAFGLVVLKILSNHKWQRPDSRPEELAYTPLLQEENE
ncbi:lysosomal membrane ascorbate-dependent ferrireductase CYB561A3 isoform X1 [Trachinotus anak]|uniref:lysosomal membrane ascorbate-dependent ferrireductase CYB561A3 isoform X1 n=3 Tax=Trachinotus anak TaxID=443729 RepID=UPI0039F1D747